MPYRNVLFVEGNDDAQALYHLLGRHGIETSVYRANEVKVVDQVAIKAAGSYGELRDRLSLEVEAAGLQRAGFLVDADADVGTRWESLRDRLREAGAPGVPEVQEENGWIGEAALADKTVIVGAWLIPNNRNSGALEELAAGLIRPDDRLWSYAGECVEHLPEVLFVPAHRGKARIHTWLAWQQEPGRPIGQAIRKGFLDPHAAAAAQLLAWVRRLFEV